MEILTASLSPEYVRIKALRALKKDGSLVASDLLGEKPRYSMANQCQQCAGCRIMKAKKACQKCWGCLEKFGCNKYNRLCFTWDRVATNYFTGLIVSSVLTHFDLAMEDLAK